MKTLHKVLIIDDSEDDRELYCRFLRGDEETNWTTTEVETGEDGLEKLAREQFDCILLDYSLPNRHGLNILQEITESNPLVAIIMLTGQGNEIVATESLKAGASDYLVKTVLTPESLKRAISNAVEKKAMLRVISDQQAAQQTFTKLLAHDLKEPLNVIRGMNALITEALDTGEYDDIKYLTERVDRASERAQELIKTLRNYTRSGEKNIVYDDIDLTSAVTAARENLQFYLREKKAVLECSKLPYIKGSAPLLIQLFQNLIGNAVKYCEAEIPELKIHHTETASGWLIHLTDNGIGIPTEYKHKVFEPSFRLHSQDLYAGSGIGLATCKNIVERHYGQIWCEDNPTGGTIFNMSFPKASLEIQTALAV